MSWTHCMNILKSKTGWKHLVSVTVMFRSRFSEIIFSQVPLISVVLNSSFGAPMEIIYNTLVKFPHGHYCNHIASRSQSFCDGCWGVFTSVLWWISRPGPMGAFWYSFRAFLWGPSWCVKAFQFVSCINNCKLGFLYIVIKWLPSEKNFLIHFIFKVGCVVPIMFFMGLI